MQIDGAGAAALQQVAAGLFRGAAIDARDALVAVEYETEQRCDREALVRDVMLRVVTARIEHADRNVPEIAPGRVTRASEAAATARPRR